MPDAFIRPARFSPEEWDARVQLAACYRIFDHLGWTEMIFNHITLRVPGPERVFLINPFGLHYREVTPVGARRVEHHVDLRVIATTAFRRATGSPTIGKAIRATPTWVRSPNSGPTSGWLRRRPPL